MVGETLGVPVFDGDGEEVGAARRAEVFGHDAVEAVFHVLGLELLAVVKGDTLAQMEDVGYIVRLFP